MNLNREEILEKLLRNETLLKYNDNEVTNNQVNMNNKHQMLEFVKNDGSNLCLLPEILRNDKDIVKQAILDDNKYTFNKMSINLKQDIEFLKEISNYSEKIKNYVNAQIKANELMSENGILFDSDENDHYFFSILKNNKQIENATSQMVEFLNFDNKSETSDKGKLKKTINEYIRNLMDKKNRKIEIKIQKVKKSNNSKKIKSIKFDIGIENYDNTINSLSNNIKKLEL